jgi:hypothetical protein
VQHENQTSTTKKRLQWEQYSTIWGQYETGSTHKHLNVHSCNKVLISLVSKSTPLQTECAMNITLAVNWHGNVQDQLKVEDVSENVNQK